MTLMKGMSVCLSVCLYAKEAWHPRELWTKYFLPSWSYEQRAKDLTPGVYKLAVAREAADWRV